MLVLIVENNPVSAKIMDLNLQKEGYSTLIARSGSAAMDRLDDHPDVDLVIADIHLAELDGISLVRRMKEKLQWEQIAVVLSTALVDVSAVREAVSLGCRQFLLKPIKVADLIEKVREALEGRKKVLRGKSEVIIDSGMDSESYEETLKSFSLQVSECLELMPQLAQSRIDVKVSQALSDLSEGAALMGAERLLGVLDGIGRRENRGKLSSEDFDFLINELKSLQEAFHTRARKGFSLVRKPKATK